MHFPRHALALAFAGPLLLVTMLAGCAGGSVGAGAGGGGGGITIVPAQVKEPPGPTDASGMGATATPSPTAPGRLPASAPAH
jgi:hypothetical protein